jgi:hypothetical protein
MWPGADEYERSGLYHLYNGKCGPGVARDGRQPFHYGEQFWLGFQPHAQRVFSGELRLWSVFRVTILFYIVSVVLYYVWFWGKKRPTAGEEGTAVPLV